MGKPRRHPRLQAWFDKMESKGLRLLYEDKTFIQRRLSQQDRITMDDAMRSYARRWYEAMKEPRPRGHCPQNRGRYQANMWLKKALD